MEWPRVATNPTYNQIAGTAGGIFLKDIPMGWVLVGVPLLVGVVYYAIRHREIHAHTTAIEKYTVES